MKTKHQEMVSVLTKNPNLILLSLDHAKCNLLHASNGLADEYFEFRLAQDKNDKENQLEELGDLLFYTEALIIGHEKHLSKHKMVALGCNEMMQLCFQVVKRHVFYEQELDTKNLVYVYHNLKGWIGHFATTIGKTIKDVEAHNISKLAKRYEGFKYSDQAAKNRVDKANEEIVNDPIEAENKYAFEANNL
jgi:uncharacterized protein YabN with tetrapyrrole methylase and pyrophosphatase domain